MSKEVTTTDTDTKLNRKDFLQQFQSSSENLISPEVREKLADTYILVGGCGSVGGNMAKMCIQEGAMNMMVTDPDIVEEKNLNRQPYVITQVGENKAEALEHNLHAINPHARIQVHPEGLTKDNISSLVYQSDIVLDGIDIEALDIMYWLHHYAQQYKKPLIVGYDLAQTGMIVTYRYDQKNIKPLKGEITQEIIENYQVVRDAYKDNKISKSQFLDFIYDAFVGPVSPFDIPPEFLEELISRTDNEDKTSQLPRTAQLVGAMTIQQIENILRGKRTKFVSKVDLASVTTTDRPNIIQRGILLKDALKIVRARKKRVEETLQTLNLEA